MIKIDFKKLAESSRMDRCLIVIDVIMVWLIGVNLTWIMFDSLFAAKVVQNTLAHGFPGFVEYYRDTVHSNFILYDLVFIYIYLAEFFVRWVVAVIQDKHKRWFFYPLVHWYDLLGCIPAPAFRWLRLLRVVDIVQRLQRMGVTDVTQLAPVRLVLKISEVIVEEISDRVVINVLNGAQTELQHDSPLMHQISHQLIAPRKSQIAGWLADRVNHAAVALYDPRRDHVEGYVKQIVSNAISDEARAQVLSRIPLVGEPVKEAIEETVSDVVFSVLDTLVTDIGASNKAYIVQEFCELMIDELITTPADANDQVRDLLVEAIELVKGQVAVKRWQDTF